MTEESFSEGLALLLATMPSLKPEKTTIDIWKKLLDDLSDEDFKTGVLTLCRNCEDVYPGTNIVAKIRRYAVEALPRIEQIRREIEARNERKLLEAKYERNRIQ